MTSNSPVPGVPRRPQGIGLPPPDTPGGLAVLGAISLGTAYILVFVGAYSALSAEALWIVSLNLLIGLVVSLLLVLMIASDRARAEAFELDFARTVEAHQSAGVTLVEASPLGGILRQFALSGREQRRAAREHAYSASPAIYSTGLSLFATLLVGLAYASGSPPDVIGLALFFELGAFTLLVLTAGMMVLSVGRKSDVVGLDVIVLRRWSGVSRPTFPYTAALVEIPWALDEPNSPDTPSPWSESGD
jgi:hypothetical protein